MTAENFSYQVDPILLPIRSLPERSVTATKKKQDKLQDNKRKEQIHVYEGGIDDVVINDAVQALKNGRLVIVSGPPGAGKTFWSRIIGETAWQEAMEKDSSLLPCYVDFDNYYTAMKKKVPREQWTKEQWDEINAALVTDVDSLMQRPKRRRKMKNAIIVEIPATDTEITLPNGEVTIEDRGKGARDILENKYPFFQIDIFPTPSLQEFSLRAKEASRKNISPEAFSSLLCSEGVDIVYPSTSKKRRQTYQTKIKQKMAESARPQAVIDVLQSFLAMIERKLKGVKKYMLDRIEIPKELKKFGKAFTEQIQKIIYFLKMRFKKDHQGDENNWRIVINNRAPRVTQYI